MSASAEEGNAASAAEPGPGQVARSTASQIGGRVAIALARLALASIIIRTFGVETFGWYALLVAVLSIGEWLLDFGTIERAVKEMCRDPRGERAHLAVLVRTKLAQLPVAVAVVALTLVAMRYPADVVRAGLAGAVGFVFFAGVLVQYAVFRARVRMELAVISELVSVLAMLPMLALAGRMEGGLVSILLAHTASRAVFFGMAVLLGRASLRPFAPGGEGTAAGLRAALPFGLVGLGLIGYDALDLLVISRVSSEGDLAAWSVAQRLTGPVIVALGAVGVTLYSIAGRRWPDRAAFGRSVQQGFDAVWLLAGMALVPLSAAAGWVTALLGEGLEEAVPLLRVLAVLCVIKALTLTLSPLLYVIDAQQAALRLITVAVVAKVCVLVPLAAGFGAMGAAGAAIAVEITFITLPLFVLLTRRTGWRCSWRVPARVAAIAAVSIAAGSLLPEGAVAGLAAAGCYAVLVVVTGTVRLRDARRLLAPRAA